MNFWKTGKIGRSWAAFFEMVLFLVFIMSCVYLLMMGMASFLVLFIFLRLKFYPFLICSHVAVSASDGRILFNKIIKTILKENQYLQGFMNNTTIVELNISIKINTIKKINNNLFHKQTSKVSITNIFYYSLHARE